LYRVLMANDLSALKPLLHTLFATTPHNGYRNIVGFAVAAG
jgi:hypothetical protein